MYCPRHSQRTALILSGLATFLLLYLLLRHGSLTHDPPRNQIDLSHIPNLDIADQTGIDECPPPPLEWKDPLFKPGSKEAHALNVSAENRPPQCRPPTPLFIAFGSSACMLEQTVLSYIAEGWPSSQIVVFDNSGFARQNAHDQIAPSRHTFLNHTKLRLEYGVSVYLLPTRLSFAQYQNLLLELANREAIGDFYWAHQDTLVRASLDYPSFFNGVLAEKYELAAKFPGDTKDWAFGFFDYDRLTHVNTYAAERVGHWDVLIPYYPTDCDYYGRVRRMNILIFDYKAGDVFDVAECIQNTADLFVQKGNPVSEQLDQELARMASRKEQNPRGRNTWQGIDVGIDGGVAYEFDFGYRAMIDAGRKTFKNKWGTASCDISSLKG